MKRTLATRLVAAVTLACVAGPAGARAEDTPPADPPLFGDEGGLGTLDAQELRSRLELRLEQADALRARLAEMIDALDRGECPDEVLGPVGRRLLERRLGEMPGLGPAGLRHRAGLGPPPGGAEVDLEEVRAFIDEHLPLLAARLEEAEGVDPERAERMLSRMAPRLGEIMLARDEDPAFARLRLDEMRTGMDILGATRSFRQARESGGDLDAARAELRALVERQVDLRLRLERHRIDRGRADLAEAEARLAEQQARREALVEEHLSRIVDRALQRPGPGDHRGRRRD